ncbi:hypothetical protein TTHERM_00471710 (macronuclear) [Tetrahymena thermophila SB210]|uniref:Uncharacterized protein n=1 Tax=Tetrahymena thermophila (strain SB210) TaxID=312017 RepID=I7LTK0_TETTS|nr:hypothetical protein TTHERM_00471710 [Tetrahymena thermophila SB210]EAR85392.1 hypothetical protein TTHERM_00471710 [Tetrahymena thermophila SB210]|eukprot:XP_001033055.1 hypothetical protein TTHERM_00471710 [Tetrahymena thermophila SB210]
MDTTFNQYFQPSPMNRIPDLRLQNIQTQKLASGDQQNNQFIQNRFGGFYNQQLLSLEDNKNQSFQNFVQSNGKIIQNLNLMKDAPLSENLNLQSFLNKQSLESNMQQQTFVPNNRMGSMNYMMQNNNNQMSENQLSLLSQLTQQQKQLLQQQNLQFNLQNQNSNNFHNQNYNHQQFIDLNREYQNQSKVLQQKQYSLNQHQIQQAPLSNPLPQQSIFNNQLNQSNDLSKNININQQSYLLQNMQQQFNQNFNNQLPPLNTSNNLFINNHNNITQQNYLQNILQLQKQIQQEQDNLNILKNLNNSNKNNNNLNSALLKIQLAENIQKYQYLPNQFDFVKLENSQINTSPIQSTPIVKQEVNQITQQNQSSHCLPFHQVSFYNQQEIQKDEILKILKQQPNDQLINTKKEIDQSQAYILNQSNPRVSRENETTKENQLNSENAQILQNCKIEEKELQKDLTSENTIQKNDFLTNEKSFDQKEELNSQTIQEQSTNLSNKNYQNEDASLLGQEQEEASHEKQSLCQSKNSEISNNTLQKSKNKSKKRRSQKEYYLSTFKKQKSDKQNSGIRSAFAKRNGQQEQPDKHKTQSEDQTDKAQTSHEENSNQQNITFEQELEQQKYEEMMQKKKDMQNESNYTKNILKGFRRFFIKNFYNNKKLMNNFEKYYSINSLNNEFILKLLTVSPYANYFKDFLQEDPEWWMDEAKITNKERQRQIFSLYQKQDISLIKTKRKNFNQKIIGKLEKSGGKEKQTCEDQQFQEENDVINSEVTLNIQDLNGQQEQNSDKNSDLVQVEMTEQI